MALRGRLRCAGSPSFPFKASTMESGCGKCNPRSRDAYRSPGPCSSFRHGPRLSTPWTRSGAIAPCGWKAVGLALAKSVEVADRRPAVGVPCGA